MQYIHFVYMLLLLKKNLRRWSLNIVIWILLASVYMFKKKLVLSKKESKELIIKNIIFVRKTCKLTIGGYLLLNNEYDFTKF